MRRSNNTKLKKIFCVLIALLIVGSVIIWSSVVIINKRRSHRLLNISFEDLKQSLDIKGYKNITKKNACEKTQVKYGEGANICVIALDYNFSLGSENINEAEIITRANNEIESFLNDVGSISAFQKNGSFESITKIGEGGFSFGGIPYQHRITGADCSARYDFNRDKRVLDISFYCKDFL